MTETQQAVLTALAARGISTPGEVAAWLNQRGGTVQYSRKGLLRVMATLVGKGYARPTKRPHMTWYDITDAGREALPGEAS